MNGKGRSREEARRLIEADRLKRSQMHQARKHKAYLIEVQGNRCAYCKRDLTDVVSHIDHIVPLAKGGTDDLSNLCAACPECNHAKGNKNLSEFLATLGAKHD